MDEPPVDRHLIQQQVERMLSSPVFRRAERSSALLRFIVEKTLNGQSDRLKEYTLGAEALGRGESFDPRADPVVRAEASRLRTRVEQYYQTIGREDPLLLRLPKGSYVPQFTLRTASKDAASAQPPAREGRVVRLITNARIAWLCAIVAIVFALAAWLRTHRDIPASSPVVQFDVELKSDGVLGSDVGTDVVISQDGSRIVFVSRTTDGRTHLNTRRLADQRNAIRLPGTDGARVPFISPDGRWIGFWADGKVKKIPVDGGSPVILCEAADLLGASWGEDDVIVMASEPAGKLWRVPGVGGAPQVVIDLTSESALPRWPQILPGGKFVLYTASTGAGADLATIEVQSLRGGNRKVLVHGGTFGRYLASGHLAYVNQGTLYAVPFDLTSLAVDGAATPLLDDVSYSRLFGYAQVDVSRSGALVYRTGGENRLSMVDWIDRADQRDGLLTEPNRYSWLRLSPDGRRLAVTVTESGVANIVVYNARTGDATRITQRSGDYSGLTWLPNGNALFFGGARGIASLRADRLDSPSFLPDARAPQIPWSVSPDGDRLAYYERNPETGFDLWTVPIETDHDRPTLGKPEPFLRTTAFEVYPSFSPDGRWITYASNESGAWEIYVRRFPDNGTKVRVSTSGGVVPRWSPNGRDLLYRTDAQRLMVVTYRAGDNSFVADAPRPWSSHSLADSGVLPNFDIAPDGSRVLALMPVARPEDQQSANHVTLVLNFFEEVRRRVGSR